MEAVNQALNMVAQFMALSARTAPKTRGQDFLEIKILEGNDLERLAGELDRLAQVTGRDFFSLNANSLRKSAAVLMLSLVAPRTGGLNCGECGVATCEERRNSGEAKPLCAWRVLDLGIALGSAVKTASIFNADNRIMYSVGVAAKNLGLVSGEMAVGVPLAAAGKNVFFDLRTGPPRKD